MGVFTKVSDFFSRHRNKFLVGGIIITGSVVLTKYAQQKLREWQEKEAREFFEITRKQQHFESTERTCNQSILNMSKALINTIYSMFDTDEVINQLKENPDNKVELWDNLKIMVFAKICTTIYSCVMLVIMLRVQLNVLGGYIYRDQRSISTEEQERYFSLCQNLIDNGLKKLSVIINDKCKEVVDPITLKKPFKLIDFENAFWAIQSNVATDKLNPTEQFKDFVSIDDVVEENLNYRNLIRDTLDLVESDEFKGLTNHCVSRSFSLLEDQLAKYFGNNGSMNVTVYRNKSTNNDAATPSGNVRPHFTHSMESDSNVFMHPAKVEIPLAKLIPILNGLVLSGSFPDKLVSHLIINEKVKTFGANIYECFCQSK